MGVYDPELAVGTPLERVLTRIGDERVSQDAMKAAGRFQFTCADDGMTDFERFCVLGEEVGEVAREVLTQPERRLADDTEGSLYGMRKELIQVAAVAAAWVEALDRRIAALPDHSHLPPAATEAEGDDA
jgi:hypothetical protein